MDEGGGPRGWDGKRRGSRRALGSSSPWRVEQEKERGREALWSKTRFARGKIGGGGGGRGAQQINGPSDGRRVRADWARDFGRWRRRCAWAGAQQESAGSERSSGYGTVRDWVEEGPGAK